MSHAALQHCFALLCPWLLLVWGLQCALGGCGLRLRGWPELALLGLLAAGLLALRLEGTTLAGWAVSLNANASIPFTGLLAATVWERAFSHKLLAARERRAGWVFGSISGLLLYPFALGWGRFDPYGWGWHFSVLFVASAVVTGLLLWKQNRFGFLLLLAILAYRLQLLESTNYWDYLLDPVYCLVSLLVLGWECLPRRMNLEFQRKADFVVGVPLCALFSFLDGFRRQPAPAASPRRILVILLSEMGSLVLAQPMFAQLKQRYPGASLHVLLFARNREVLDLMGLVPKANVLTLEDRSLRRFAADAVRVLLALRALKCDVALDCELFARVSSLLSYLSGAPVRVGFHRHTQEGLYRGSFINRPVMYNPYRHIANQFLTLVAAIESETMPPGKTTPSPLPEPPPWVVFSREELEQWTQKLHADFPSLRDKRLVLVYPGGGLLPMRAWPPEYYFQLCASLLEDGHAVGIIGLKADKVLGQALVARCQDVHCVDLTDYTQSIRHLLGLFHRASLVVTNDGGPAQFAALTPVPVIVFFGPETPALYGPLSRNAQCLHLALPCSPCLTAYNHRTSPCDGDNQCLKQMAPERVLAAAREMLARTQSSEPTASTQYPLEEQMAPVDQSCVAGLKLSSS